MLVLKAGCYASLQCWPRHGSTTKAAVVLAVSRPPVANEIITPSCLSRALLTNGERGWRRTTGSGLQPESPVDENVVINTDVMEEQVWLGHVRYGDECVGVGRERGRGDRWVGCMGGMTDEVTEHVDNATGHEICDKRPAACRLALHVWTWKSVQSHPLLCGTRSQTLEGHVSLFDHGKRAP